MLWIFFPTNLDRGCNEVSNEGEYFPAFLLELFQFYASYIFPVRYEPAIKDYV